MVQCLHSRVLKIPLDWQAVACQIGYISVNAKLGSRSLVSIHVEYSHQIQYKIFPNMDPGSMYPQSPSWVMIWIILFMMSRMYNVQYTTYFLGW